VYTLAFTFVYKYEFRVILARYVLRATLQKWPKMKKIYNHTQTQQVLTVNSHCLH